MRRFRCPDCEGEVFFGSLTCESCGTDIAFRPPDDDMVVLEGAGCANRPEPERCNWEPRRGDAWCAGCELDTDHRPFPLRLPFQRARRRTLRQFLRLGIEWLGPLPALRFELVEGTPESPVTTGHADGLVTLDVSEADPEHLEGVRMDLGERYRTPLGHTRHELGHWYWAAHRDHSFTTEAFRRRFGDERAPYADALRAHYASADDGSWRSTHVSHYAAAHPWEDFAESFAHYLHLDDTYETAVAYDLAPAVAPDVDFEERWRHWVELTTALNELNRSMGTADPYPFVVGAEAVDKVRFVADAVGARSLDALDDSPEATAKR